MMEPAILFRRKVYVGEPRHLDALNVMFKDMSTHQKIRIYDRIAEGKESILFGWVDENSKWNHDKEFQNARMTMYGFD